MSAATDTSASTRVEWIADPILLQKLEPEWNDLLQNSNSDCLFLTWEWLSTWWKHLAEDRSLAVLTVRCDGRLAGIAPCCLKPADWKQVRPLPVMEFLGSGFVGSDYLDFIVRAGCEEFVERALAAELATREVVHKWTQLRHRARAQRLASELNQSGWIVGETTTNVCPYIPLEGATWESYLGTLGSEHRYNFHRKWKRLNRDFSVRFEAVRTPEECEEAIPQLIEQHNTRWSERGGSDAFHLPALTAFHREFSQIALERGWLRLYVLRLDEKPAAFLYGFLYGRKFYFYQSGFDAAYAKHSPGLLSMGLAIRSAIEEGAEEYDLLHGDESYKAHWSLDKRDLIRLELYPPNPVGRICRTAIGLARASRTLASRVIPGGPAA
jgi:CelD/BcsL family acetyltransferase involved in cellulose biosynthesis